VPTQNLVRTALRLGYDELAGYLRGGFDTWQNEGRELNTCGTMDSRELQRRMRSGEELCIVDVRSPEEVIETGSIAGALHLFVGDTSSSEISRPDSTTSPNTQHSSPCARWDIAVGWARVSWCNTDSQRCTTSWVVSPPGKPCSAKLRSRPEH
jgi:rhodanese-related sulfurtransferase